MPLRLLHASDLHLVHRTSVPLWRYLNKRLLGRLNLALRRGHTHDARLLGRILEHARQAGVDRMVLTGDVTNLALESEFERVAAWLEQAGVPVTVIPGNHDVYTRGSFRQGRFERYLGRFMPGERPGLDPEGYPFVQRLGEVALVGVSTARPSGPFLATGRVGPDQLARLAAVLAELAASSLVRVVLIHHPVVRGISAPHRGLQDLEAFGQVIRAQGAELVLHGHAHIRVDTWLEGPRGPVPVHAISSGTSLSTRPDRRAAFSIYEVAPGQIRRELYVWDGQDFRPGWIPPTSP